MASTFWILTTVTFARTPGPATARALYFALRTYDDKLPHLPFFNFHSSGLQREESEEKWLPSLKSQDYGISSYIWHVRFIAMWSVLARSAASSSCRLMEVISFCKPFVLSKYVKKNTTYLDTPLDPGLLWFSMVKFSEMLVKLKCKLSEMQGNWKKWSIISPAHVQFHRTLFHAWGSFVSSILQQLSMINRGRDQICLPLVRSVISVTSTTFRSALTHQGCLNNPLIPNPLIPLFSPP